MPSTSAKQARFMAAAAHDPSFAKRVGISQSVARDFNQADKGSKLLSNAMKKKRKAGGRTPQAAAMSYALQMAGGGMVSGYFRRPRGSIKPGLVASDVPGRTDKIAGKLPSGSYVVPADVVSAEGQNNTLAGAKAIDKKFKQGPYGSGTAMTPKPLANLKPQKSARMIRQRFAYGGEEDEGSDVIVAGGEHILYPETVQRIGKGDPERGFNYLDNYVRKIRQGHIKTLRKLPGPKK